MLLICVVVFSADHIQTKAEFESVPVQRNLPLAKCEGLRKQVIVPATDY